MLDGEKWKGWFSGNPLPVPETGSAGKLEVKISNKRARIEFSRAPGAKEYDAKRGSARTHFSRMNAAEAAVVEGVDVYGATSLAEVVEFLRGQKVLEPVRSTNDWYTADAADQELDFGEVKGQRHVKRAVEVAAAGGHNILSFGTIYSSCQFVHP